MVLFTHWDMGWCLRHSLHQSSDQQCSAHILKAMVYSPNEWFSETAIVRRFWIVSQTHSVRWSQTTLHTENCLFTLAATTHRIMVTVPQLTVNVHTTTDSQWLMNHSRSIEQDVEQKNLLSGQPVLQIVTNYKPVTTDGSWQTTAHSCQTCHRDTL